MRGGLLFTGGAFGPPPGLIAHRTILGGWTGGDEPPPRDAPEPSSLDLIAAPARQVAEARSLALVLQRPRSGLRGWDRTFVREIARWRREPSAWEAEQVAELAERLHWQGRDGATPC